MTGRRWLQERRVAAEHDAPVLEVAVAHKLGGCADCARASASAASAIRLDAGNIVVSVIVEIAARDPDQSCSRSFDVQLRANEDAVSPRSRWTQPNRWITFCHTPGTALRAL